MKLYYFDIYGRAEPARLLLTHSGVEFEDVRLTGEEFGALLGEEGKVKYGQLPLLERDGKFYAQTHAILRYLGGSLTNPSGSTYYPEDLELRVRTDELFSLIYDDFFSKILSTLFLAKTDDER